MLALGLLTLRFRPSAVSASPSGPTNATAPVLDAGDGKIGTTMSVTSTGEWSITPDETEIRWMVDGAEEGTGSSLVVDVGFSGDPVKVQVRVRVTDGVWSSWTDSNTVNLPAAAAPVVTTPPSLTSSGSISSPVSGDLLGFSALEYTGNAPPSLAYDWQSSADSGSNWTSIGGAGVDATCTIPNDFGVTVRMRLKITLTNGSGEAVTYSNETADFGP